MNKFTIEVAVFTEFSEFANDLEKSLDISISRHKPTGWYYEEIELMTNLSRHGLADELDMEELDWGFVGKNEIREQGRTIMRYVKPEMMNELSLVGKVCEITDLANVVKDTNFSIDTPLIKEWYERPMIDLSDAEQKELVTPRAKNAMLVRHIWLHEPQFEELPEPTED